MKNDSKNKNIKMMFINLINYIMLYKKTEMNDKKGMQAPNDNKQ